MALKFEIDNIDTLDEPLQQYYTKGDGGKYYLEVDGAVSKSKLTEFRDNNVKLMKQLETFKSIDIDEYNKLKDDALNGSKLGKEEVDKLINDRVKNMRSQFESESNNLKSELKVSKKQLETLLVDSAIRQASSKIGVLSSAIDDVVLRAKSVFKVEDGVAVPYDKSGIIYGKDGASQSVISIENPDWEDLEIIDLTTDSKIAWEKKRFAFQFNFIEGHDYRIN